jgi:hypothetical protein
MKKINKRIPKAQFGGDTPRKKISKGKSMGTNSETGDTVVVKIKDVTKKVPGTNNIYQSASGRMKKTKIDADTGKSKTTVQRSNIDPNTGKVTYKTRNAIIPVSPKNAKVIKRKGGSVKRK